MSDVDLFARIEASMCMTYGRQPGGQEEGRISREDFEDLKRTLRLALSPSCSLTPVARRAIQETLGEPVTPTPAPRTEGIE